MDKTSIAFGHAGNCVQLSQRDGNQETATLMPLQWTTKPIHERSNFACESNCGSGNKDKSVGNYSNKGKCLVLCYTKVQNFSLVINLISILQTGHLNESGLLQVLQICSFCLYHSLYPSGHTLNHISTNFLWYSIHSTCRSEQGWCTPCLPQIFNRVEVRWLYRPLHDIDIVLFGPFWGLLRGVFGVFTQLKIRSLAKLYNCQEASLKNAGVQLSIYSCTAPNHCKSPFFQRLSRGGGWRLLWSTSDMCSTDTWIDTELHTSILQAGFLTIVEFC